MIPRLGLIAIFALAMAALAPSPAAAEVEFEATSYPASVSGEQVESHTLTLDGLQMKCSNVTVSGELLGPSETLALAPVYSKCVVAGLVVTIEANGCTYVFAGTEETSENNFKGTQDISCPAEASMIVKTFGGKCEAKMGGQSGLSSVTYKDELESSPPKLDPEQNLSGIHYTITKDEGACPFTGTGEKTNGTLKGALVLTATFESEGDGLAMVLRGKTRLCNAAPVKRACVGKVLPAGTLIKAEPRAKAPPPSFAIESNGTTENLVECKSSTITLESNEEEGEPLKIKNLTASFAICQTFPEKTKCTVEMKNAPATGLIKASILKEGSGYLVSPLTIKIECGTEMEGCEYKKAGFSSAITGSSGAVVPPMLEPIHSLKVQNVAAVKGCAKELSWLALYEVLEPKALFVTT